MKLAIATPFKDVLEFHRVMCPNQIQGFPTEPTDDIKELRIKLIEEEVAETIEAMRKGDIEGVADGLADIQVVVNGAAIAWGINLDNVHNEVHEANMRKLDGPVREDGKRLKPAGWVGPNIEKVLHYQKNIFTDSDLKAY